MQSNLTLTLKNVFAIIIIESH